MGLEEENRQILRRLVDRIEIEDLVDEVLAAIETLPEYNSFVGTDDDQEDRGRISIRMNLEAFLNWAVSEGGLGEEDTQRLRDLMGVRASEGRPIRDGLIVYRRAMRAAWQAVLVQADEREKVALGGAFELPLEWLDLVSDQYEAAYAAEQDARVSAHERRSRWLIELITTGRDDDGDGRRLAEGLDFELTDRYRPFVATLPEGSAASHLRLAGDLRRAGHLTRSEAVTVTGLAHRVPDLGTLPPPVIVVVGPEATREELARRTEDLRLVAEMATRDGRSGLVDAGDYAVQLMVARSPEQVGQLRERYFDPLTEAGRQDLIETLVVLAGRGFDRSVAAEELGVHRNTMAQRIERIEQLSDLDLRDPATRGAIWLAAMAI